MKNLLKLLVVAIIATVAVACSKNEPAPVVATGITINPPTLALVVNETKMLTATVIPANAADKTVTWSSSAPEVAGVRDGLVTALTAGSATITAATAGGKTANCEVTVSETVIAVRGITLDTAELTLYAGETYTLTATVVPDDATDKTVTWSSSAPEVAGVADGLVTALTAGSATITAATAGGKTADCRITVNPDVYAAGANGNVATIWKNGEILYSLTDGANPACVNSVFVYGSDVYAAGYELINNSMYGLQFYNGRVWKNGNIMHPLTSIDYTGAFATSVYVSDGDVYLAEKISNLLGLFVTGKIWKNGEILYNLSCGPNSIYVSDNDVYTAGDILNNNGFYAPTLWKNDIERYRFAPDGIATSVYVYDGDVYVAGSDDNLGALYHPIIWKNGEKLYSHGCDRCGAYSVYVYDGDVYVAGNVKHTDGSSLYAMIWKNGEVLYTLTDGQNRAQAYSVYVYGGDVYAAGYEYNNGNPVYKVWKNGEVLHSFENNMSAVSIFVK
jgi:hypothetical protein